MDDVPGISADLLFAPRRGQVWPWDGSRTGPGWIYSSTASRGRGASPDGGGSFTAAGDMLLTYGMGGAILSQPAEVVSVVTSLQLQKIVQTTAPDLSLFLSLRPRFCAEVTSRTQSRCNRCRPTTCAT